MKTPEQMAEEYIDQFDFWSEHRHFIKRGFKDSFIAGYQAAKDQLADADKVMNSSNNSNGWISVKERLPEIDKYVLITHRTSQDYTSLKVMGGCRISDDEYEIWGDHAILADYVDYWMPLPTPPDE